MPIERPNPNNPRPLKPTLASNRTAKTPLTPRLAGAPTAPSTASSQSSRPARTSNGGTPRPASTALDNVTPVKAFLSSNITPRSSSRKSRVGVDSASSTPSGTPAATPTSSRPSSTIDYPQREQGIGYSGHLAVGSNGAPGGGRPRSIPGQISNTTTPTPRLPLSNIYNHTPSEAGSSKDVSPLFFHANDAKPNEQPAPQKKTPTFYYANGKQDDAPRRYNVPSPPPSAVGRPQPESKFFHADSLSEPKERPPILTPPPMSASPELLLPPNGAPGLSPRMASPTKDWAHLSYRKGASQIMRPSLNRGNSAVSILSGPNTPDLPDRARRRSSVASSVIKQGHVKSASLSSIDSVTSPKRMSSNEPCAMTPSPLHTENRILSNVSLADSIASAPSPLLATFSALPSPGQTSPIKLDGKSALEMMNELAANARRERKVLDLEISNSSLLAINRSLEKEIRKQKAEIRRFRRMSRAGHFATDPAGSTLDTFSAVGAGPTGDLSDMSEEEEEVQEPEVEDEEEDPDSSDSSFDEGAMSPGAQLERDEVHRLRDEKRLQLDLSKHRDMLADSQKMNQSLKRCLGWTEQLIKDGQKALEHKVHVSDVKLGGRVLISEDDNDITEAEESKGLLSPWSPMHHAMDVLDSPFFPNQDRTIDRDSGVDIDGLDHDYENHDDPHAEPPMRDESTNSSSPVKDFRPHLPGQWVSYANITEPVRQPFEDLTPLGSPFEERIRYLHASIDALEGS
ncbi:hypothetical protein EJ02DRAFT_266125 [Clathrospora elynae]|uniref:Uncharacterized protein n=1 Tax=Clathrospora elynae TaxID=706981 RepID=A0A6A5SI92_9PLEO|nr:hypothetical protein EJ02DRAFT_266125 [Clathrospora elynae]